jgi:hypothetical protein
MFNEIEKITKTFEKRIYLANQLYEQAIRRAHNEYYDALTAITAPTPETTIPEYTSPESEPEKEEPKIQIKEPTFDKIIDMIFKHYDPPISGTSD